MSERHITPPDRPLEPFSDQEERAERAAILASLHRYAHRTGASYGDDVLCWFDIRMRSAIERAEHAPA
jgi:hypothetical protein